MTKKWDYKTIEFEAQAAYRQKKLQDLLLEIGPCGWELVYVSDGSGYTSARIVFERRLLIFKRPTAPVELLLTEEGSKEEVSVDKD